MKTKYVCRGLISLYVNFHKNRTMWLSNLHVRIRRWGKRKKSGVFLWSPEKIGFFDLPFLTRETM